MVGTSALPRLRESLFVEVRRDVLDAIGAHYRPGDRLPSEPELAAAYGVSRPTIREVLRSLEADGVVRRVHGVGTFVTQTQPAVSSRMDLDLGVTEAVVAARQRLGVQVLRVARERASGAVAERLEVPLGSELLWVERIIRANDIRAAHAVDTIPIAVLDAADGPTYQGGSIYRFLEERCGLVLTGGLAEITAVNADRRLGDLLGVPTGAALLRMDQVERIAGDRPVLYSCEHYVPSVFNLNVRRIRHASSQPSARSSSVKVRREPVARRVDERTP
jgi:GntR family transcriptional regulator